MRLVFTDQAWEDYLWWQAQDKKLSKRINTLIEAIQRDPFTGIGKPESLKHELYGCWSRRITIEHRLLYRVERDALVILQLRYHY